MRNTTAGQWRALWKAAAALRPKEKGYPLHTVAEGSARSTIAPSPVQARGRCVKHGGGSRTVCKEKGYCVCWQLIMVAENGASTKPRLQHKDNILYAPGAAVLQNCCGTCCTDDGESSSTSNKTVMNTRAFGFDSAEQPKEPPNRRHQQVPIGETNEKVDRDGQSKSSAVVDQEVIKRAHVSRSRGLPHQCPRVDYWLLRGISNTGADANSC